MQSCSYRLNELSISSTVLKYFIYAIHEQKHNSAMCLNLRKRWLCIGHTKSYVSDYLLVLTLQALGLITLNMTIN